MDTFAALDVGTNSIKLLVARGSDAASLQILQEATEITRLGEGVQASGEITAAAMDRTILVIGDFMSRARALGAQTFMAVGTMCLRTARNAAVFVERVRRECGLDIETLDGRQEARLAHLAVLSWLEQPDGKLVIFDVGGGSTEFIIGRGRELAGSRSLDLGAIRLTEQYLLSDPVTPKELRDMLTAISSSLGRPAAGGADMGRKRSGTGLFGPDLGLELPINLLVGVGGTVTTLAAIKRGLARYDAAAIQGSLLAREDIDRMLELFLGRTVQQRRSIVGLEPKRADIILAGTGIVKVIMETLSVASLLVSDRGVRYGLLVDRFSRQTG